MAPSASPPPRDLRKLRPWYVLAAMAIAWVVSVSGAARAFSDLSYLRGDPSALNAIDQRLAAEDHPLVRAELVRQRTLLEASGRHHERAVPIAAGRLLLQLLLVLAAGAVLLGRRGGRNLALQAMVANAVLMVVAHVLLEPARLEAAAAVAEDLATNGFGLIQGLDLAQTVEAYREEQLRAEAVRPFVEVALYLLGMIALTRGRARVYFDAVETQPEASPEGPEEP